MTWVREKLNEIGMERMLQDLIDELSEVPSQESYIFLLIQDLEMTLSDYKERYN